MLFFRGGWWPFFKSIFSLFEVTNLCIMVIFCFFSTVSCHTLMYHGHFLFLFLHCSMWHIYVSWSFFVFLHCFMPHINVSWSFFVFVSPLFHVTYLCIMVIFCFFSTVSYHTLTYHGHFLFLFLHCSMRHIYVSWSVFVFSSLFHATH